MPSPVFDSVSTCDEDLAALGELDGVADQVDEHLPQPAGIADRDAGHVGQHVADELETLLFGAQRQRLQQVGEMIADRERDLPRARACASRSSRNRGCR